MTGISGPKGESALKCLHMFHAAILQRPRGQQCRSDDEVIERAKEAASSPAALRRMVEALVADASADDDEETAPMREALCATRGRRALEQTSGALSMRRVRARLELRFAGCSLRSPSTQGKRRAS